jgi:hypothetical protein
MRVAAVLLAALLLPAGVGAAGAAGEPSGLRGVVMRGPVKPVCGENEPCEKPAAGVVLQFARKGVLVARVKTGETGRFRVKLRPGRYAVTTRQARVGSGLTPRFVRVRAGLFVRVDFHLDTGIQ